MRIIKAFQILRRFLNYNLRKRKYFYRYRGGKVSRVNIIFRESGWILQKFANEMMDNLKELGIEAVISSEFDKTADINHYVSPDGEGKVDNNTTFMITHVFKQSYLDWITKLTKQGAIGICMSKDTMEKLISSSVPRNKICYINPAQDGMIKPRKVSLGFTHRVYHDNRKRESILIDVCQEVSPDIFKIIIMGAGWDSIIQEISSMGFEVEYYPDFDKEKYNELMINLDYYCYFGFDEGSMGYLDAVAAGIGTIVTPQGYHLDTECPITYPVETVNDIVDALHDIQNKKLASYRLIASWTWENYVKKHLEIWEYQKGTKTLDALLKNRGFYKDGIFSILLNDLDVYKPMIQKVADNIRNL